MRLTSRVSVLSAMVLIAGCSAYSSTPTTTVLPSSNRSIDIVLHRGDVRMMDCSTLAVLQTYNSGGQLIDSKEARGTALHCTLLPALIDAGGRVGAAAIVKPAITTIRNAVSNVNTQQQGQLQWQKGTVVGVNTNTNTNNANGGAGGNGGNGGNGGAGGQGNNGGGNGDNDGTNPGSDNENTDDNN